MAEPVTIWTDHTYRVVLLPGGVPAENNYVLEVKDSDKDALGKARWTPLQGPISWELFETILRDAVFPPVVLDPDEMY